MVGVRKYNLLTWAIIFFFVVGILQVLILSPSSILIPLLIFGLIFYFLKHPEKLRGIYYRFHKPSSRHKTKYDKQREITFKVINGKKDKNDDDKQRYH